MNNYTQNSAVYSKQLRITYLNSFQYNNTTTVCCHRTVHLYIKFTTSGASQCCIVRTAAQQSITSEWMTVLLAVLVGWTAMLHATTAGSMIRKYFLEQHVSSPTRARGQATPHLLDLVIMWLPPPTCRGALSEYAALAMPRLAHISGRAAWQRSSD